MERIENQRGRQPVRALLVEDNPDHALVIAGLLAGQRALDVSVETEADPNRAIARIETEPFDAILLDYCLPGMSGLEVLRRINRRRRRPVIILTCHGDEGVAVRFFRAGAYDYIQKTMDRNFGSTLGRAIREMVRTRGLEARIEEEGRRTETILDALGQMLCCLDENLVIRHANRAFRGFLQRLLPPEDGASPKARIPDPRGRCFRELFGRMADGSLQEPFLRSILLTGRTQQEEIALRVGGEMRTLWVQGSRIRFDDEGDCVLLSFTDLTEQRSTQEWQLRLARALEASCEGVVITDLEGRIQYVNRAYARMTGHDAEDLRMRRSRFFQATPDRAALVRSVRRKLARGEQWRGEVLNRKKDGRVYFSDMTVSSIQDDAGRPIGYVTTERDITERRIFTDELIKARETAEESLRAKDMFLATVSHELRTPLTSIIGFADLLLLEEGMSGNAREFAKGVLRAGRHLKQLIQNILDLSRFSGGRFYLDLEEVQPGELLGEAIEMAGSQVGEKPLAFDLAIDSTVPPRVMIDRMKLYQVLLNLLTNAVKYAQRGEIRVEVGLLLEPEEASLDQAGRPQMLLFSVCDQGPGVPEAERQRIFESFVQVPSGVQRSGGGTGLGLAITRRLVELMGGTIWVEPAAGGGSRFSFTLPLATPGKDSEEGGESRGRGSAAGPLLSIHRMAPGSVPGEGELAAWGYRIEVTGTVEEMARSLEGDEPVACVVSGTSELADSLQRLARAAALTSDRVAWLLFVRGAGGEAIPLCRVVPLEEDLGPRSVIRLMRAVDGLPPGGRHLLVDERDRELLDWGRRAISHRGLHVVPIGSAEPAPLMDEEEPRVLLLDPSRDPNGALDLLLRLADHAPRFLLAVRESFAEETQERARLNRAWRRHAPLFLPGSARRLRWMLNAIHTAAARGRFAAVSPFQILDGGRSARPAIPSDRPVLVVDDCAETLHVVCCMLDSLGVPHRAAPSGEEAIRLVGSLDPCLVLMDVELPDMDGCSVTRNLLRSTGRELLPIVAMSAHTSLQEQRRCHAAGCVDFLAKPIERCDLERILARWAPPRGEPAGEGEGRKRAAG